MMIAIRLGDKRQMVLAHISAKPTHCHAWVEPERKPRVESKSFFCVDSSKKSGDLGKSPTISEKKVNRWKSGSAGQNGGRGKFIRWDEIIPVDLWIPFSIATSLS
jgi:hypothetical protein